MGDCETRLDVPNCSAVIYWKHVQIRFNEIVVTNSFYLREGYVIFISTVDKG